MLVPITNGINNAEQCHLRRCWRGFLSLCLAPHFWTPLQLQVIHRSSRHGVSIRGLSTKLPLAQINHCGPPSTISWDVIWIFMFSPTRTFFMLPTSPLLQSYFCFLLASAKEQKAFLSLCISPWYDPVRPQAYQGASSNCTRLSFVWVDTTIFNSFLLVHTDNPGKSGYGTNL
jgi:hypothetical protein